MSYSRGTYVKNLMVALGNPLTLIAQPNSDAQLTYYWLIGWSVHESASGQNCPLYNLFGCGHKVAGSINAPCSTHGVQEYQNLTTSVLAMSLNLASPLYTYLHAALLRDDVTTLQTSTEIQAELGSWISGSRSYGGYNKQTAGFVALGKQHENDQFPDGGSSGGTGPETSGKQCSHGQSCIVGQPLGCPTNYTCYPVDENGCPDPQNLIAFTGFCFSPDQVSESIASTASSQANSWLTLPLVKIVIGSGLILIAATMLIKPIANSGVGQQVTKIASVAA